MSDEGISKLFGPRGEPMSQFVASRPSVFAKAEAPKTGEQYGGWAGRGDIVSIPGQSLMSFDLSKLTLQDFRVMRDHPTISSSLFLLSMMQHQSKWHIEATSAKAKDIAERNLRRIWTDLCRSMAHANWAGYSPNVLQWGNDENGRDLALDKIKDLYPEECAVNWKEVELATGPGSSVARKQKVYDGIKQAGFPDIPQPYSFWYPLLMEHGNYGGTKLLRRAFKSWYFSEIIELYRNRYLERFGEPTPIARAPFGDSVTVKNAQGTDEKYTSTAYMAGILQSLRNRSVVVMPSEREYLGDGKQGDYTYELDFLESQMRGADFERAIQAQDEKMSLSLFTPVLLLRTADVGSYNLGVGHMQMYLWMMNGMNKDRARYIDRYILEPLMRINFASKNEHAHIVFTELGDVSAQMIGDIIKTGFTAGRLSMDMDQLQEMTGLKLEEIEQLAPGDPTGGGANTGDAAKKERGKNPTRASADAASGKDKSKHQVSDLRDSMVGRAHEQYAAHLRKNPGEVFTHKIGFHGQVERNLRRFVDDSASAANEIFAVLDGWSGAVSGVGTYKTADDYAQAFGAVLDSEFLSLGMVDLEPVPA